MTARRAAAALLALLLGAAAAQGATLRGEVGLDTGLAAGRAAGATTWTVPTLVRARLELDAAPAPDASLRVVLLPSLGPGADPGELRAHAGLQEAVARVRRGDVDLSVGYERLPLVELRLVEPVALEGRLPTGEPRGALGARVAAYDGAWRYRLAALAPTGADLVPDGAGGAVSVRREDPAATVEAHLAWTTRPLAGLVASGSVGDVVVYGEAWLLADPWAGRGGAGATGYAGDWLWTAEAAWAAPEGDLRASARPVVAASASRPLGLEASLDVGASLAWPRAAAGGGRAAALDAAASLRRDVADASLTLTPALRVREGTLAASLGLAVRGYF